MSKTIIPHKIIFNFDLDGNITDTLLMYRIQEESGSISSKFKNISIKSQVNVPAINIMAKKSIDFTKKQEGIPDA